MEQQWSRLWDDLVGTPFGLFSTWEQQLHSRCQLPALHFHVLQTLALAPEGRLRLQELAEAVRHSQSGTTRLVDRMEREGLIERVSCASDRRVTWALLSEKGKSAYDQAEPLWDQFLSEHLKGSLSLDEASTLSELLGRLSRTLAPDAVTCPNQRKAVV